MREHPGAWPKTYREVNDMSKRRGITSGLYRAARVSSTVGAVASGNPSRVARRAKNVAVGRSLGKAGVWRSLWK